VTATVDSGQHHRRADPGGVLRRALTADGLPFTLSLVVFVVSRVAVAAAGVRFQTSWLDIAWQVSDLQLLEDRLLETVWYGHSQPPVLDLAVGLVLKFSPLDLVATFTISSLLLGVVLTVACVDLLRRLGAGRVAQTLVTCLAICSPQMVLYSNWVSYEFPVTVGLLVLVDLMVAYVARPAAILLAAVVGTASLCVLTRSLLHPVLLVAVVAVALIAARPRGGRSALVLAVVVPLAPVLLFVGRSLVLWEQPSLSSWFGMNVARVALLDIPVERREELISRGDMSPLALELPFSPYERYAPHMAPCEPTHPDVADLTRPAKANGTSNFDYECYLPVFQQYGRDALAGIRAEPMTYLRSERTAYLLFFSSTHRYYFLGDNAAHLDGLITAYDVVMPRPSYLGTPIDVVGVAATALTLAAAAVSVVRWWRDGSSPARAGLVLAGGLVLFVMVAGNLFEVGENQRFRVLVEPITWVVAAAVISRLWHDPRRPRRHHDGAVPDEDRVASARLR
jgi:hypothetical protein